MGWKYLYWKDLPEICQNCEFRDSDAPDEYSEPVSYCEKGLILPTKKNSCATQKVERAKASSLN